MEDDSPYRLLERFRTEKTADLAIGDLLYAIRLKNSRNETDLHASWGAIGMTGREAISVKKEIIDKGEHVGTIGIYFAVSGANEVSAYRWVNPKTMPMASGHISKAEAERRTLILDLILEWFLGTEFLSEKL